ncbi:MAG: secondary thiamine-phosphate synthase enzyme YjbQ [Candidatus Kapaibacteriota bacterium]
MMQKIVILPAMPRGIHSITRLVERELETILSTVESGILHVFLCHTSAAITINEDADPDVTLDMMDILDRIVPMHRQLYRHTAEGPDDMTSHALASLIGCSVTIPIQQDRMALGTWQGIHLCEFRHHARNRKLIATIHSIQ